VPLIDKEGKPVQTVAQAVAELKRLQTQRSDNTLPTLTRTPKFDDYAPPTRRTPAAYTDIEEIVEGFVEGFLCSLSLVNSRQSLRNAV